jgi:hypothetical protein
MEALMQSSDSITLVEVALDRVTGGGTARAILKGAAAGTLAVAPFVVPPLIDRKDDPLVMPATMALSWGALGGWAVHGFRALRRR